MGNPNSYSKFGFQNAKSFNVQTSQGENLDYFMGLDLYKDSIKGISGRYYEDGIF
jgi:predicted N-acetyltransferase YhbS